MKTPFRFSLNPRLFALLALGFVLATIVGTVSHELGHYIPARYYGFEAKLHYASVSYGKSKESKEIILFQEAHKAKLQSAKDSPEKDYFNKLLKDLNRKYFLITLGGPVQTMIAGTIGFIVLWFNSKKIRMRGSLSFNDWIMVLLCFFWSRQLANALLWTCRYIFTGEIRYTGDEIQLAMYMLSLKPGSSLLAVGSISYTTGIAALAIIIYTTFYIIPFRQRYTFFVAGLLGSALGWTIWMRTLGPVLMP